MRLRQERVEKAKDRKIPFYEKLPKHSQFYLHYMTSMYVKKLN